MSSEPRTVLSVEGLHAGYGHVAVVRGIDMRVAEGELVTLIGANGAGKSTLLKALVGLVPPSAGTVRFLGEDITRMRPERAVRAGLALVPEGRMLFGPMSVEENLELGAQVTDRTQTVGSLERVFDLFPVLAERRSQTAATLSGGEQQMLAVARALMARPRLLLLDEPSLGLAPKVIKEIFGALRKLKDEGLTILLVEQDARLALKHSDRGYVMRTGSIALAGDAADLLEDDDVRLIYLGAWRGEGESS
ncbi:MAG: ABC transporter ATP-binding protein [Anaerosomatales bacterium]|nr:ABC transporter ATP-binding protein [Anaerosomatales bacterium]MDT8433333.1 ABC transporter ATP-binding protein [Anaerosomatales bacterium]